MLVNLGAAIRLAAPFAPGGYAAAGAVASVFLSAAFVIFAVVYGRYI